MFSYTTLIRMRLQNLSSSKAKLVKVFKLKAFPHYDAIGDLIDGTRATGEGVFRPGITSASKPPPSPGLSNANSSFVIDPTLEEISYEMETPSGIVTGTQVSKA